MMGRRNGNQGHLFYEFRLDEAVPDELPEDEAVPDELPEEELASGDPPSAEPPSPLLVVVTVQAPVKRNAHTTV